MNGSEVCRHLIRNRPGNQLPIIFLAEKREQKARLDGLEPGAVDYIAKPFDVLELCLQVRNWLWCSQLRTLENTANRLPA